MNLKNSQTYKDGLKVEQDFKSLFAKLITAPNVLKKLLNVLMARNMQRLVFINHLLTLGLVFLVYYDKLSFWLSAILIFITPFIVGILMTPVLVKNAYGVVSILTNNILLNRHYLITFTKTTEKIGIRMHFYQFLELVMLILKLIILYNLNIYFVVVYIVLSIISLHSVKNILTANYGEGVKHVKEENLVDSSIIQDFIYNPDLVKRQKNENRYYYFPQRLRLLFFSAFKNEFYFSITIIFFFLFYEYINTYFTFFEFVTIGQISMILLISFTLGLLIYNWILKNFFLTYFNVLFLWHTDSDKTNVLIHSIIPVFSFSGRLNILLNEKLNEEITKFYNVAYLPILPKAGEKLDVILMRIISIILFPLMFFPKIYGFLQHRFENTNRILSRDLNWKKVFSIRLAKTDFILFHIDIITQNVKWELDQIIGEFMPSRVLILTKTSSNFSGLHLLDNKSAGFINQCHHIEYKDDYFGRLKLKLALISLLKKMK